MSKILFVDKKNDLNELCNYIDENRNKFFRVAYSYVKNEDDALDIIQDAVYKAIINYDKLKNPEYVKTWFYRILINCSIDSIRKNKKIVYISDENIDINQPQTEEKEYIDLYKSLDKLDEKQRTILVLRYFEDMKIEDIAKILDSNVNTVKSRLYAAIKKLKIEMEE